LLTSNKSQAGLYEFAEVAMKKSNLLSAVCAVLFSLITMSANATLHGRLPLTPGDTDYQAAYDDVLDLC
jgi:hypothetical protein